MKPPLNHPADCKYYIQTISKISVCAIKKKKNNPHACGFSWLFWLHICGLKFKKKHFHIIRTITNINCFSVRTFELAFLRWAALIFYFLEFRVLWTPKYWALPYACIIIEFVTMDLLYNGDPVNHSESGNRQLKFFLWGL